MEIILEILRLLLTVAIAYLVGRLVAKLIRPASAADPSTSAQSTSWITALLTSTAAADWPKVFAARMPAATAQAPQLRLVYFMVYSFHSWPLRIGRRRQRATMSLTLLSPSPRRT